MTYSHPTWPPLKGPTTFQNYYIGDQVSSISLGTNHFQSLAGRQKEIYVIITLLASILLSSIF
jgi:hypothetical protein